MVSHDTTFGSNRRYKTALQQQARLIFLNCVHSHFFQFLHQDTTAIGLGCNLQNLLHMPKNKSKALPLNQDTCVNKISSLKMLLPSPEKVFLVRQEKHKGFNVTSYGTLRTTHFHYHMLNSFNEWGFIHTYYV